MNEPLFIWDFVADTVLGQILDWIYGQVMGFLGNIFAEMGNMGADLFELNWVQSIVLFFSYLGWALYVTGLVVACFECGIEYSSGRGNLKETALCAIKGFMAVSLFTVVPVRLYELSITLQASLTAGITGYGTSIGEAATEIVDSLSGIESLTGMAVGSYFGFTSITSPIMLLFCIILMGYAVIKVFFSNLKRGGILLIQIAVGSLYMFSVPRGFTDGFVMWVKQVIALCLTTFLQSVMIVCGLILFKDQWLMGVVFCLVVSAIVGAAGSILPGVGALVVTGPMLYAQKYAFLAQAREGRGIDLNDLFRGFRDDFGGTLLISLLSGLFIFLWSLLLFIPGIVKAYAYSMVYYVKADHPEYGWRECLDESQRLMTGHKWEKFVLDLSFIGWGIVGSLCLGVGTLWVMTYMAATEAQYYEYLTSGRTSPEF